VKYPEIFETEILSQQTLTPEEAVTAIIMVTAYANGQPSQEENESAINIINTLDIFENYDVDEFQSMMNKIIGILDEEGIGVLFKTAVESITDDLGETAFQAAAEILLGNGEIDAEKSDFFAKLTEQLDISEDVAQDMIDELINEEEEAYS